MTLVIEWARRDQIKSRRSRKDIHRHFYRNKNERPALQNLLSDIKKGDTLIVTKLDRLARSVQAGSSLIKELLDKGIAVRILNMGNGPIDNSSMGMLLFNILLAFAEFERDMMELLDSGNSYGQVVEKTGISKSTLIRERKVRTYDDSNGMSPLIIELQNDGYTDTEILDSIVDNYKG